MNECKGCSPEPCSCVFAESTTVTVVGNGRFNTPMAFVPSGVVQPRPMAHIHSETIIIPPASTFTALTFNDNLLIEPNIYNLDSGMVNLSVFNTRITAIEAGDYVVGGFSQFDDNGGDIGIWERRLAIFQNSSPTGIEKGGEWKTFASFQTFGYINVQGFLSLSAGDYIELYGFTSQSGSGEDLGIREFYAIWAGP